MRIATYNQMFALDGTGLISVIGSYLRVNFAYKPSKVYSKAVIDRTTELVEDSRADIVGISEILNGQQDEFTKDFKEKGFNFIAFEHGHRKISSKMNIMVAIASKLRFKQIEVEGFPMHNSIYGGGGMVHCYFPDLKLNVINVHLTIPARRILYKRQILFLKNYLSKIDGKFILMGDFNLRYEKLRKHFPELNLASNEIRTCSNARILRHFKFKDFDHIFVNGFDVKHSGALEGYSDHKLLYSDLS